MAIGSSAPIRSLCLTHPHSKPRVDPVTGKIVTYTAQGLDMPLSEFATLVGVVAVVLSVILALIVESRSQRQ